MSRTFEQLHQDLEEAGARVDHIIWLGSAAAGGFPAGFSALEAFVEAASDYVGQIFCSSELQREVDDLEDSQVVGEILKRGFTGFLALVEIVPDDGIILDTWAYGETPEIAIESGLAVVKDQAERRRKK